MTSSRTPSTGTTVPTHGGWTDEAVEMLKALWDDPDLSAAVIARRLGVTRNAVLGKIHRLGLSKPRAPRPAASPLPPARRRALTRRSTSPSRPPGASRASDPPAPEAGPPLVARLEDLPRRGCHWPMGDPQAPEFAFCGRWAGKGPYCAAHAAIAYRGPGVDVAELARLLRC